MITVLQWRTNRESKGGEDYDNRLHNTEIFGTLSWFKIHQICIEFPIQDQVAIVCHNRALQCTCQIIIQFRLLHDSEQLLGVTYCFLRSHSQFSHSTKHTFNLQLDHFVGKCNDFYWKTFLPLLNLNLRLRKL